LYNWEYSSGDILSMSFVLTVWLLQVLEFALVDSALADCVNKTYALAVTSVNSAAVSKLRGLVMVNFLMGL
jgi:hypothetical protein